jgi:hypothetical protein
MHSKKILLRLLLILIVLIMVVSVTALRGQEVRDKLLADPPTEYQQISNQDQFDMPITDLDEQGQIQSLAQTTQNRIRLLRGDRRTLLYKNTSPEEMQKYVLTESSYEIQFRGRTEHDPEEYALPTDESNVVFVGECFNTQAFLSEDKTRLYSEFEFRIEQVLKNKTGNKLGQGGSITTMRYGGGLRFPSGKVIYGGEWGRTMPHVGRRYVLFLRYDREADYFPILTGYEVRAGVIYPLDGIPRGAANTHDFAVYGQYKGVSEQIFFADLHKELARPPRNPLRVPGPDGDINKMRRVP